MKKFCYLACVFLLMPLVNLYVYAINVYIDGVAVEYNDETNYPFSENGAVFVPLYPTLEAFGADSIVQDNPNGTVIVKKGDIYVNCNTSENCIYRNGVRINSDYGLVWRGPLYVSTGFFKAFDAEVSLGGSGVIITTDKNTNKLKIFGSSYDSAYRASKYFNVRYEPEKGMYFGSSANGYENAEKLSLAADKEVSAFTVTCATSDDFTQALDSLRTASDEGKIVRFCLFPENGELLQNFAEQNAVYSETAQKISETGARTLVYSLPNAVCRYSDSYVENSQEYIEAFRNICNIFKTNNPSATVVWQVCSCMADRAADYYPGDAYVDYAEISVCRHSEHNSSENENAVSNFAYQFGYRKPLLFEAALRDIAYGNGIAEKLLEMFTYLPIKFPQFKAVFLEISAENADSESDFSFSNALKAGVSGTNYLSDINSEDCKSPYYFELANNVTVPPSKIKLYSYLKNSESGVARIECRINGVTVANLGTSEIPHEMPVDFSNYPGQTVSLEVVAYGENDFMLAKTDCFLNVSANHSADNRVTDEKGKKTPPIVPMASVVVGILAISVIIKKINDIFC